MNREEREGTAGWLARVGGGLQEDWAGTHLGDIQERSCS